MNTIEELKDFARLPKGWHYGFGGPISKETIDLAIGFNEKAENYGFKTEAFPGVDGEILLSVYGWDNYTLNITIYYSDIEYNLEINDETIEYEEFISIEDTYELIDNLASVEEYER